jgi:hypothetical protein
MGADGDAAARPDEGVAELWGAGGAVVLRMTGPLQRRPMDSTDIAVLVTAAQRNGNDTLRGASGSVRRVLEATGLATTLRIVP